MCCSLHMFADFHLVRNGSGASLYYPGKEPVVKTAIEMLITDSKSVCKGPFVMIGNSESSCVFVGTLGMDTEFEAFLSHNKVDYSDVKGKWEAFKIMPVQVGRVHYLLVGGSDPRGTAYGVLELSRRLGVSPWVWWADAKPEKKETVVFKDDEILRESPSVPYRGIFINDEDWGLMPWSGKNYEPSEVDGVIGPKTSARIFELLLRLRANTYWPPMHECSVPFFMTEGNREMARKYGIFIGTSHCEPMACNAAGEWSRRGVGDYDYVNNSAEVYKFWENRVKEVAGQDILYTLGMRGVHDGRMQGAKTLDEQKNVLARVLSDQRGLLEKYVNQNITSVPQVFIPYKEVLDIYHAGLQVPEEVTLMWCDDNYGYVRHFPTEEERARKGGNGIYYHVSYWGRPHDYLWLGTAHPALIYQQMKLAYDKGIQKMWILNVGDIKPAEYQIELFMDMGWNIDRVASEGVALHLQDWLKREFGASCSEALLPALQEYYRLAYIRKPEFMGNTREEEREPEYRIVKDLPWNEQEINTRLDAYGRISDCVEEVAKRVPESKRSTYFELVQYPVQAAAQMNRKCLYAQLARHGKADWEKSDAAYDSIAALTRRYNALEAGKWNQIMDFKPRRLPVFERVERTMADAPMTSDAKLLYHWNGADGKCERRNVCEGLGYEGKAVSLAKGEHLSFSFPSWESDSVVVDIRLLPCHPVSGGKLRIAVSLDGATSQTVSYETQGRSEEWKMNVLRNQAIRTVALPVKTKEAHRLSIQALDEGVVVDQVNVICPVRKDRMRL